MGWTDGWGADEFVVGLSRKNTHEERGGGRGGDGGGLMPMDTAASGRLFTEEELSKAMSESTLKPARTVV